MNDQEVTWMLANRLSELTGYSVEAIRIKAKRKEWPAGAYWRLAPDGNRVYNYQAIQAWMSGDATPVSNKKPATCNYNDTRAQGPGESRRGTEGETPSDGKYRVYV